MSEAHSFQEVMARLREGDEAEAAQVFKRFANRLIGLAHLNLNDRVRQKVDAEDVVQSVFRTFFRRQAGGEFELNDWDSVWSILVVIAVRKCGHQLEHFQAACRNVQREQGLATPPDGDSFHGWEAVAAGPTPVQAMMLAETIEHLMRLFTSKSERPIVELNFQGYGPQEVSEQTGR